MPLEMKPSKYLLARFLAWVQWGLGGRLNSLLVSPPHIQSSVLRVSIHLIQTQGSTVYTRLRLPTHAHHRGRTKHTQCHIIIPLLLRHEIPRLQWHLTEKYDAECTKYNSVITRAIQAQTDTIQHTTLFRSAKGKIMSPVSISSWSVLLKILKHCQRTEALTAICNQGKVHLRCY